MNINGGGHIDALTFPQRLCSAAHVLALSLHAARRATQHVRQSVPPSVLSSEAPSVSPTLPPLQLLRVLLVLRVSWLTAVPSQTY